MTAPREPFRAIEIDALDDRLAATAVRKRIPSLTHGQPASPSSDAPSRVLKDGTGGRALPRADAAPAPQSAQEKAEPVAISAEPADADEPVSDAGAVPASVRRRPLSLEVPDYLARELKVKAATEAVTVRYLVLSALAGAGYRVDRDELEEDGRRLR